MVKKHGRGFTLRVHGALSQEVRLLDEVWEGVIAGCLKNSPEVEETKWLEKRNEFGDITSCIGIYKHYGTVYTFEPTINPTTISILIHFLEIWEDSSS